MCPLSCLSHVCPMSLTYQSHVVMSMSPVRPVSLQHSVGVVHVPGRRPFGQNLLTVYIDGEPQKTAQLRFPSLSEVAVSYLLNRSVCCGGLTSSSLSLSRSPPAASAQQDTGPPPPPPRPPACRRPCPPASPQSSPSPTTPPPSSAPSPFPCLSVEDAGGPWTRPFTLSQQDSRTPSGGHPPLWTGSWALPSSATRLCSRHRSEPCTLQVSHNILVNIYLVYIHPTAAQLSV